MRPLLQDEAELVYEWATSSDATPYWYGEMYGDQIPSREDFFADFKPHYFDESDPEKGRAFAIEIDGNIIGHVHYNNIDRSDNSVELDIMIMDRENWNRGYGSDALRALSSYLFEHKGIGTCFIEAILKNPRAVRAYQKAGFRTTKTFERMGGKRIRLERRKP